MHASPAKPSALLSFGARTLRARGGAFAMLQTLVAQGFTMSVNLATGILTARLLGPVGRGEFAAASLWLLLPSFLAVSGLQNGIVYQSRKNLEHRAGAALAGLLLASAVFVPVVAVCWVLMPSLMHGYGPAVVWLARFALLGAALNVWNVVLRQAMLANKDFGAYNLLATGAAAIYLVMLVALGLLGAISPANAVFAQIASTVIVFALGAIRIIRGWRGLSLRLHGLFRPLISYSLRAAPIDLVTVLTGNIDRLILIPIISPAEFGLYAVAMSFARILMVLQTAVSAVTLADLTGKGADERQMFVHRTFRVMLLLLVIACAAVLLVDRQLLGLAYGAGFTRAVPIFRVLLLEAALTCLGQMLMQVYLAAGRPTLASSAQVASFITTTAGVLFLAPMLGSIGAAIALTIGSAVRLLVLLVRLPAIQVSRPSPFPQRADLALLTARLRVRARPAL